MQTTITDAGDSSVITGTGLEPVITVPKTVALPTWLLRNNIVS